MAAPTEIAPKNYAAVGTKTHLVVNSNVADKGIFLHGPINSSSHTLALLRNNSTKGDPITGIASGMPVTLLTAQYPIWSQGKE